VCVYVCVCVCVCVCVRERESEWGFNCNMPKRLKSLNHVTTLFLSNVLFHQTFIYHYNKSRHKP